MLASPVVSEAYTSSSRSDDGLRADRPAVPRLFVAGATGWLGRHVLETARRAGIEAFGIARRENVEQGVLACDAVDAKAVEALVHEIVPAAIVNCVRTSADDAGAIKPVRALVSVARRRKVRLVHVGSAAEYGEAGRGVRLGERRRPRPLTPYGRAKAAATQEVLSVRKAGCDAVVGRVFNMIGPGEGEDTVAGAWAARIGRSELGKGMIVDLPPAVRDFVDVRDAARALLILALAPLRHPLYNVCTGRGTRIDQLVRRMLRIAGLPVRVRTRFADGKSARGPARSVGSPIRMRSLGWRPVVSLDQSCRELLAEYLGRRT